MIFDFCILNFIMIYLFHGEDTYRSLKKLNELLDYFKKNKNAGLSLFNIDEENFDSGYFETLIKSCHLFGDKNMVILKRALRDKTASDFIMENIKKCGESNNIFIFHEDVLVKPVLDAFVKNAQKIWEFNFLNKARLTAWLDKESQKHNLILDYKTKESILLEHGSDLWSLSNALEKIILGLKHQTPDGKEMNIFGIVDAFSNRQRLEAWLLLQKYQMRGMDAEEVFWKIFWQVKNLLLVKLSLTEYRRARKVNANSSAAEFSLKQKIKLHQFVLQKCLKTEKLFSQEELDKFSGELAGIYQNSRYGNLEFGMAMEKFLLKI